MDSSDSRVMEANSSNKDAFFTLWFYSINLCFLGFGICKDDQGIANKEEVEKTSTGRATISSTGRVNVEKVEDLGISWIDIEKVAESGINKVDIEENLGTGGANKNKDLGIDGVDVKKDLGIGKADVEKNLDISRAGKQSIGKGVIEVAKKLLAKRRVAA